MKSFRLNIINVFHPGAHPDFPAVRFQQSHITTPVLGLRRRGDGLRRGHPGDLRLWHEGLRRSSKWSCPSCSLMIRITHSSSLCCCRTPARWSPTCSATRRSPSNPRRWSATCGRLPRPPSVPNMPTHQPPSPVCKVRLHSNTTFAPLNTLPTNTL